MRKARSDKHKPHNYPKHIKQQKKSAGITPGVHENAPVKIEIEEVQSPAKIEEPIIKTDLSNIDETTPPFNLEHPEDKKDSPGIVTPVLTNDEVKKHEDELLNIISQNETVLEEEKEEKETPGTIDSKNKLQLQNCINADFVVEKLEKMLLILRKKKIWEFSKDEKDLCRELCQYELVKLGDKCPQNIQEILLICSVVGIFADKVISDVMDEKRKKEALELRQEIASK